MRDLKLSKFAVPFGVIGIIVMMVVPLPTFLLDLLIATNITGALLILMVSMFVQKPLDFSVFPALLLVMTLFRLALNISATRLVLRDGDAGKVIHAFGDFVVGGSLVIGLVIFLILIIVQMVVVTKGAERVAEVGARFTLDAMPGKQMAIDADLNAGLINETQAKARRAEVAAEADFYGAMDGGSKFVKGDAMAAIIITVINLVGGFTVGILQQGLSPADAMNQYSLLTVGDGLVSQIPALLLSVSTGLITTRSATSGDMGSSVTAQLGQNKLALRIAGGAALGLCVIPGLPKVPFLIIGATTMFIAQRIKDPEPEAEAEAAGGEADRPAPDSPEQLLGEMRVDPLELALSPDLVDLVDTNGGDLLDRVRALRRKMALELGIIMPPVRTRDDLDLPLSSYAIRISGVDAGAGQAPPGTVLAIGDGLQALPGRAGVEPVFGLAGKWVPAELHYQAELSGATVVDRASVIITHLAEIVRQNASRLLGREDVRSLAEMVKQTHPVVVEELTPTLLSLGQIQRVLQALLDEGVPVRDLVRIFESLSLRAKVSSDHDGLVEAARAALGPAIAAQYAANGRLTVITLEPMLEQGLLESLRPSDTGAFMAIDGMRAEAIVTEAGQLVETAEQSGITPVLACSPQLRLPLMRLLRAGSRRVQVLSYSEISGSTAQIETMGVVNGAYAGAA
ncbi:flagellar biosynthesis protein FlhA [Actinoplanes sp. NPDC051475]|uniref:flagellar biosynthesis protein FlhA n=1 Tax=Actinoplanes sp. NPDC051475 TaxID=3157225 RepID=UPI0034508B60